MRVAIASDSDRQRNYLKLMLERSGMKVVTVMPIGDDIVEQLSRENADVLLMDLDEGSRRLHDLDRLIDQVRSDCRIPVLFNDSSSNDTNDTVSDSGRKLTLKLTSMFGRG
jgi:DNA-binding NarL/FixJ family response regulator